MYVRVLNNRVFFFSQSTSCSSHCFELIHVDIWGSFTISFKNGSHFFLTIVDDYSRCTWIYLMKHKSETFNILIHFLIKSIVNSTQKFLVSTLVMETFFFLHFKPFV